MNKIPSLKRYKPLEVVQEFQKTLELELNLLNEAANASVLKRHFLNSPSLYIPQIHWDYARPHLIVMERIWGIPICDVPALNAAGINLKKLAERGVEIFFTQVFRDSFFHGRGLGKGLLDLAVVDEKTRERATIVQLLARNLVFFAPYFVYQLAAPICQPELLNNLQIFVVAYTFLVLLVETVLMLTGSGMRLADRVSGTIVVPLKTPEQC